MRAKTLLMSALGLGRAIVVAGWELHAGDRPLLEVRVRTRSDRRGRCGRCESVAPW